MWGTNSPVCHEQSHRNSAFLTVEETGEQKQGTENKESAFQMGGEEGNETSK